MLITIVVFAVYAYIGLEAWSHSRAARRERGTFGGLAVDFGALESTPIEPLPLPSRASVARRRSQSMGALAA